MSWCLGQKETNKQEYKQQFCQSKKKEETEKEIELHLFIK